MSSQRLAWIDRLKGLLILLVVLGHVAGSAANATTGFENQISRGVFKAIYLFHMPAFFFLAGLTFRGFNFLSKVKRLLVPYFVFGVLSIAVYQVALRGGVWWHPWASLCYGATFPGTDGFRCNSVLWFLPCLFSVTALFSVLEKVSSRLRHPFVSKTTIGVLSMIGYVALRRSGCPELPYGINQFFKYIPFVVAGNLLAPILLKPGIDIGLRTKRVMLMALVLYVLLVPLAPFEWDMYFTYWKWMVSVAMGFGGILGCCWVSLHINSQLLVQIGIASIGIMMVHKWFVLALNHAGLYNIVLVFPLAALASLGVTLLIRKFAPWMLGEFAK